MDPTLNPWNFEPTGLTPEQLAAMVPQMSTPPPVPPPPAPHPLEGIIPRMLEGAGGLGAMLNPSDPAMGPPPGAAATIGAMTGAPGAAPAPGVAPAAPVGGKTPEAIAGQLARWGVSPEQILPGLSPGTGGPSVGALLNPSQGIGGEAARDAAGALPSTAAPASGTAPTSAPGMGNPFKGLSMPTAPTPQKVSTPAAPRPTGTIKGGELLALMQALGMGGQPSAIPTLASVIGR